MEPQLQRISLPAPGDTVRVDDLRQLVTAIERMFVDTYIPAPRLGGGGGRSMSFAKVVLMYDASGNGWTDFPTDSEYPAYCTAKSCGSDGTTNLAESVDTWVGMNTKSDSPLGVITAADQIIAYMPGDGLKIYATPDPDVTLSGQAILGFGCWLDWARWRTIT